MGIRWETAREAEVTYASPARLPFPSWPWVGAQPRPWNRAGDSHGMAWRRRWSRVVGLRLPRGRDGKRREYVSRGRGGPLRCQSRLYLASGAPGCRRSQRARAVGRRRKRGVGAGRRWRGARGAGGGGGSRARLSASPSRGKLCPAVNEQRQRRRRGKDDRRIMRG
jgi:hypothetical protein